MLGFSVGRPIFETDKQSAQENLSKLAPDGVDSIEVFIHKDLVENLETIDIAMELDFSRFKNISLHAPDIPYDTHPKANETIELLKKLSDYLNAKHITVHPAGITDWSIFDDLKEKILLENMDPVKSEGQSVEDMREYFGKFDVGMTLDLQHSYSIDPSMALTDRLIEEFRGRIKEVHISGWQSPNRHIPLYNFPDRDLIASRLEKLPGVKVVMEGVTMDAFSSPNGEEVLREEVAFLLPFIK